MNSTYHTTYQYHFCLGENLLRGDGAQSCLSVCHQSSLSSPLSSPLLYWLRHQCWQIIQSGDDAAFRQSVIFPNNCANKPSLSALSSSLQPDPSNQVMWLTSPTIYRHVCGRIIFRLSAVYTESNCCAQHRPASVNQLRLQLVYCVMVCDEVFLLKFQIVIIYENILT